MKKIIVALSYPLCVRNFIHSGLLNELTRNGYDVRILSPYKRETFEDAWGNQYPNKYMPTSGYDQWGAPQIAGMGLGYKFLLSLRLRGYSIEYPQGSLQTMELSKPGSAVWILSWLMVKIFPRKSGIRKFLRRIYDTTGPGNGEIADYLKMEKPDLIVTATMGHLPVDFVTLTLAKKSNIKTMCILLSWDNLYSRGPVYKHPDMLLVWSKIMVTQALAVHQFSESQVKAVGPLQFVNYAGALTTSELDVVRNKFSLKADDKYILYVCGARTPQYDLEDIVELVKTIKNSEFRDHVIIVRPHPQVDGTKYDKVKHLVKIDYSPTLLNVDDPGSLFKKSDVRYMASLLYQADFVVSSWGTTALLEAIIFDRKVVQLNWFDSVPHEDAWQRNSVRSFQNYYHMREFDAYEGRLISNSPDDLVSKFRELNERDTHYAKNRVRIKEDFSGGQYDQVNAKIAREVALLLKPGIPA